MNFTLQRKRIDTFSEQKLFAEMERIWRSLGHRPSRTEWEAFDARIHYNTYRVRFGGWVNACVKFIEYQMGSSLASEANQLSSLTVEIPPEAKRQIPLGLRLKVLDRDGYSCVLCGKTPALQRGVILHIDHRIPFAKGGKTELNNLQVLCSDCNLGKGNKIE
jgi:hypothetical protein